MLSFLHFPCSFTLWHKTRTLAYMAFTPNELYARCISFYRTFCEGSGGEYRLVIAPTDSTAEYVFSLRLPEHIPGAAVMTSLEFFGVLRSQFSVQYAPVVPVVPVQPDATAWEDLL